MTINGKNDEERVVLRPQPALLMPTDTAIRIKEPEHRFFNPQTDFSSQIGLRISSRFLKYILENALGEEATAADLQAFEVTRSARPLELGKAFSAERNPQLYHVYELITNHAHGSGCDLSQTSRNFIPHGNYFISITLTILRPYIVSIDANYRDETRVRAGDRIIQLY